MADNLLHIKGLTKFYGKNRGVQNLDLIVSKGEIFGFLGPNGAGKTTTINMLLGIIRPTAGDIKIFDESAVGDKPAVRRSIGYLYGDMELYGSLTGWQYVNFVGKICGNLSTDKVRDLAERLDADLNRKIHTLSRGNRQKVGLIAALARSTKLLILDEPTTGLDPLIQRQFNDLMQEYRKAGGTVFISSHILSEVQTLCDRVAFIKEGSIVAVGDLKELMGRVNKRFMVMAPHKILSRISHIDGVENFRLDDGHAHFEVKGNPARLLSNLPLHEIQDINVSPPELEEIFMRYYDNEARL